MSSQVHLFPCPCSRPSCPPVDKHCSLVHHPDGRVEEVEWEECLLSTHAMLHQQQWKRQQEDGGSKQTAVRFTIQCADTQMDEEIRVVGDAKILGCWNAEKGLPLQTDTTLFPLWTTKDSVEIPVGQTVNYKYVKYNKSTGELRWEDSLSKNRQIFLPSKLPLLSPPSSFSTNDETNGSKDAVTTADNGVRTRKTCLVACVEDGIFDFPTPFLPHEPSPPTPTTTNTTAGGMYINSSETDENVGGGIVWINEEEGINSICGKWVLLSEKSDSLCPLLDATGVSWLVKTAVRTTLRYENEIGCTGGRLVVKTIVSAGDNSQTTCLHGCIHMTKELDGDTYKTVCGWDNDSGSLLTVRSHSTKGRIHQTRRCVADETYGVVQHSHILLTPPDESNPTVDINLWFARAEAYAEIHKSE
eukprot:GHVS01005203.1.p1 GENE.GHVS01005203.1~~GHVS01005203.1.p1  ORF type:complete len:463 (-),score=99.05 GHVS01005203.1:1130-2374(-)